MSVFLNIGFIFICYMTSCVGGRLTVSVFLNIGFIFICYMTSSVEAG